VILHLGERGRKKKDRLRSRAKSSHGLDQKKEEKRIKRRGFLFFLSRGKKEGSLDRALAGDAALEKEKKGKKKRGLLRFIPGRLRIERGGRKETSRRTGQPQPHHDLGESTVGWTAGGGEEGGGGGKGKPDHLSLNVKEEESRLHTLKQRICKGKEEGGGKEELFILCPSCSG